MDHAGASQYSEQQITDIFANLNTNIYCNPHTSRTTEDVIDQVRFKILNFFNTSTEDYEVIFTSGSTAALKTVAETFDFGENGVFAYLRDNHTSVLGMREVVDTNKIVCIEHDEFLKHFMSCEKLSQSDNNLIVFSAESNFNGFKYPLESIDDIHRKKNNFVFLDAACFVATNPLDLNRCRPDFVCVSFYKIFGYPTGLGALLVNKRASNVLEKKYYGGGTIKISLSDASKWHEKKESLHERYLRVSLLMSSSIKNYIL